MREALIFDLDGTLWDTAALCARAWNTALRASGYPNHREFVAADIAGAMGLASEELRAKLLPEFSADEGRRLLRIAFEHEVALLAREGGILYPGVPEGLARLGARYELYLVSNCDVPYLDIFLAGSGLGKHFRDCECHGRTGLTKGENVAALLARHAPRSAAYVGDTEGDRRAAIHAGIPFYFVEYGFGRVETSDRRFGSFGELVEALLGV